MNSGRIRPATATPHIRNATNHSKASLSSLVLGGVSVLVGLALNGVPPGCATGGRVHRTACGSLGLGQGFACAPAFRGLGRAGGLMPGGAETERGLSTGPVNRRGVEIRDLAEPSGTRLALVPIASCSTIRRKCCINQSFPVAKMKLFQSLAGII